MHPQQERTPGRVVIITGAAQGIGAATAWRFAEEGALVVLSDLTTGAADVAREIAAKYPDSAAVGVQTDVTDSDQCQALVDLAVERHERLDVLAVATAVLPTKSPLKDLAPEEWDRVMTVNAKGPFMLCRSAIPVLTRQTGRIVVVCSAAGQTGIPDFAAYSASKGALGAMIKSLALELAADHVTVNGVAPWHVESQLNTESLKAAAAAQGITYEEMRRLRDSAIPLGRSADAREVAAAMAFLASPEAGYITGAVLDVNGGTVLR